MYPNGLETGDVHKSLCIISKRRELKDKELVKGRLTCLPKGQEWQLKRGFSLHWIKLDEYKESKIALPGWPKRYCQMLEEMVEKADDVEDEEETPCVEWNG